MKKSILAAIALVIAGSSFASAQERRVIEERKVEERPGIVIPLPVPSVEVEKRRIETDGRGGSRAGCDSKTVHKETPNGETTIKKERCD
jgi:hypothetical protein